MSGKQPSSSKNTLRLIDENVFMYVLILSFVIV
jgi:hypothetical protein